MNYKILYTELFIIPLSNDLCLAQKNTTTETNILETISVLSSNQKPKNSSWKIVANFGKQECPG